MNIEKENNHLHHDFFAYWCIEDVIIDTAVSYNEAGNKSTNTIVNFGLRANPSREAKVKEAYPIKPELPFGGPSSIATNSRLYEWNASFLAQDVFGESIPSSLEGQLSVLYDFVKEYLELSNREDLVDDL